MSIQIESIANILAYLAASLVVLSFCMKKMIPLRAAAIGSNIAFLSYGAISLVYPVLILHSILLPMNIWRTVQMVSLIRRVRTAAKGDLSIDWLKPYMKSARRDAGTTLFRRGDDADRMFYLISGTLQFVEINQKLEPGNLFGEIALFSPDRKRTQTAICETAVEFLWITNDEIAQLCYQNPAIAFHLMRIVTGRLIRNAEQAGAMPRPILEKPVETTM